MPELTHAADGVALAYERHAPKDGTEGPAIVLVHGFGSSRLQNWKSTGWYGGLTEAGFSIVAMDCRGHGDSGKPHDPQSYGHDRMADDVIAVMDACALPRALICGYSMGGFIGLRLLAAHPERVIKLAIAGVGETYLADRITSPQARAALADALLREPLRIDLLGADAPPPPDIALVDLQMPVMGGLEFARLSALAAAVK
jgi:pimeloyl-ACP methyl ester carboxylesterase